MTKSERQLRRHWIAHFLMGIGLIATLASTIMFAIRSRNVFQDDLMRLERVRRTMRSFDSIVPGLKGEDLGITQAEIDEHREYTLTVPGRKTGEAERRVVVFLKHETLSGRVTGVSFMSDVQGKYFSWDLEDNGQHVFLPTEHGSYIARDFDGNGTFDAMRSPRRALDGGFLPDLVQMDGRWVTGLVQGQHAIVDDVTYELVDGFWKPLQVVTD